MTIYSHSRLSCFEQCPYRFKLKYIDKIIPEIEQTIEAHLGKSVHEALEWLYTQVKSRSTPEIEKLIDKYSEIWIKNFKQNIEIVKKEFTEKDYFNKGIQFLVDYYLKHSPFEDNTLEIEKQITLNLDKEGKYKIQGFIDRLTLNQKTGEYEIHDYKTAGSLPSKEKIENDRQLALYSLGIKEKFGYDKEVCLIWHYLNFNQKICSKRTNIQLEKLKQEVINLIKEIEETKEFPAKVSPLCNWCEYKNICPTFKNSN